MSRIHFKPTVIECRIYENGNYKKRSPYLGSFVIHVINETAELTLLTGVLQGDSCSWSSEIDREMKDYLRSIGMKYLTYEYKKKRITRRL